MDGIKACFEGRVGQDAQLKYTRDGKPLVWVSIAVEDSRAPEGTPAQWVKVTLFGEQAEALAPKLARGQECYAEGRLTASEWEATDGTKRYGLNLLAWTLQPIGAIGRRSAGRVVPLDGKPRARYAEALEGG